MGVSTDLTRAELTLLVIVAEADLSLECFPSSLVPKRSPLLFRPGSFASIACFHNFQASSERAMASSHWNKR